MDNCLQVENVDKGDDMVDLDDEECNDASSKRDDEAKEGGKETANRSNERVNDGSMGKANSGADEEENLQDKHDEEGEHSSNFIDTGDEANGVSNNDLDIIDSLLEHDDDLLEMGNDNINLDVSFDRDNSHNSISSRLNVGNDTLNDVDSRAGGSTGQGNREIGNGGVSSSGGDGTRDRARVHWQFAGETWDGQLRQLRKNATSDCAWVHWQFTAKAWDRELG